MQIPDRILRAPTVFRDRPPPGERTLAGSPPDVPPYPPILSINIKTKDLRASVVLYGITPVGTQGSHFGHSIFARKRRLTCICGGGRSWISTSFWDYRSCWHGHTRS